MTDKKRDIAGIAAALLLALMGALSIWASGEFSDLGAVFPRTVGGLMLILGLLYSVLSAMGRGQVVAPLEGSLPRRMALVITMLFWVFTLGPLGFLGSSALSMGALLWIANYDRWHPRSLLVYGGSTATLLLIFYTLFKLVLGVPLPG